LAYKRKKASEENPLPVSVPEPEEDAAMEDPVADFTDSGMQGIRSTPPPPNEQTLTPPHVSALE
jgi:hypothetical protein